MYVICIDDKYTYGLLTKDRVLKIGAVYKVVEYCDKFYRIAFGGHNYGTPIGFFKSRFIVIKDNRINKLLYKEIK